MSRYLIIPNSRTVTAGMKESESYFLCPTNTVMTGRFHQGDENKNTQYEYATLKAVDENGNVVSGTITVELISVTVATSCRYPNAITIPRDHSGMSLANNG